MGKVRCTMARKRYHELSNQKIIWFPTPFVSGWSFNGYYHNIECPCSYRLLSKKRWWVVRKICCRVCIYQSVSTKLVWLHGHIIIGILLGESSYRTNIQNIFFRYEKMWVSRTPEELIWGYPEPLFDLATIFEGNANIPPDGKFGFFTKVCKPHFVFISYWISNNL